MAAAAAYTKERVVGSGVTFNRSQLIEITIEAKSGPRLGAIHMCNRYIPAWSALPPSVLHCMCSGSRVTPESITLPLIRDHK